MQVENIEAQEHTQEELKEQEVANARAKLKKRFGNKTRTGGKGTQRRKKKGKPHITRERRDRKEFDFMKKIDKVNRRMNLLTGEHKEAWDAYFEDWQFEFCMELARKDIKKSCPFSLKWIHEFSTEFFKLVTIQPGTQLYSIKQLCRTTSFKEQYKDFSNIFTERGFLFLEDGIDELETILSKKQYLQNNNTQDTTDKVDVPKCTKLLELSDSEIPSKKELKKAYLKKSLELHPDKHPKEANEYIKKFKEVKRAYKQLLMYYYGKTKA